MFSYEFCEISHNTFFKEPFEQLLLHKHLFCLLSQHDLSPFQKRCRTYFLAEYFLGLFCRLGTRVSSIFPTLRRKSIFNPVEHLRWSFFAKTVNSLKPLNIFAKEAPLQVLDQVLNTLIQMLVQVLCKQPLKGVVK